MTDKTKILYHANCPDGFASAWAAWRKFGDYAEYIPCSYGDEPPNVDGAEVYILDFSFKRDVMMEMALTARHITILDHHVTAEADLADLAGSKIDVTFDMQMSGATLAWRQFHGDESCWLVRYAEDRDLWRHALPNSKQVNAYLMSMPRLFEAYDDAFNMGPEWCAQLGEGCLTYIRYYVESMKKLAVRSNFAGHADIPVVNAPYTATSEVVGELAEDAPFAVGWHVNAKGNVVYSLRSRGDFDVSELALRYGGGGHKKASGFMSEKLPWALDD